MIPLITRIVLCHSVLCSTSAMTAAADFVIPDDIATLEFALSDPASPVEDGDTLILTNRAVYDMRYTVTIPNLTIRGAVGEEIVLDPGPGGRTIVVDQAAAGFVIENIQVRGGGIQVDANSVRIDRCSFIGNTSTDNGGAIQVNGLLVAIEDSRFVDNTVIDGQDGGAVSSTVGRTTIDRCFFYGNSAGSGGALAVRGDDFSFAARILNSEFRNNVAAGEGGAIRNTGRRTSIDRCVVVDNSAGRGGGIWTNGPEVMIRRSSIIDNRAVVPNSNPRGGGIFITQSGNNSTALVESCLIAGNRADLNGGGIAASGGGGSAAVFVANCTIVANSAPLAGGMSIAGSQPAVDVRNSIIRLNSMSQFDDFNGTNLRLLDCNVEGLPPSDFLTSENIDLDAKFIDAFGPDGELFQAEDGDFRLLPGSPSIDAGDATFQRLSTPRFPEVLFIEEDPTDLGGFPRANTDPATIPKRGDGVYGMYIDQGAYEYQPGILLDVNRDGLIDFFDVLAFLAAFDAAT